MLAPVMLHWIKGEPRFMEPELKFGGGVIVGCAWGKGGCGEEASCAKPGLDKETLVAYEVTAAECE